MNFVVITKKPLSTKGGDTQTFEFQLQNYKREPINLTGSSLTFNVADNENLLIERTMTIVNALNGIVSVSFTGDERFKSDVYNAEIVVNYSNSTKETFPSEGYLKLQIGFNLANKNTFIQVLEWVEGAIDYANTAGDTAHAAAEEAEFQSLRAEELADETRFVEPYNAATTYQKNNMVTYNGHSFIAKQRTTGNVPPDPSVTQENDHWGLQSRKGNDGTGTVNRPVEKITATEGQDTFTTQYPFDQNQNRVDVIINGVPQDYLVDFTEPTSTSIKTNVPLNAGDEVILKYFRETIPLASDVQTNVDNLNTITSDHNLRIAESESELVSVNNQLADTDTKQKNVMIDLVIDEGIDDTGTDVTVPVKSVVDTTDNLNLYFPYTPDGFVLNELVVPSLKKLRGNHTKLSATEIAKKIFYVTNTSNLVENTVIEDFEFSQPIAGGGGGTENDHSAVAFWGSKNAKVLDNIFKNSSLGLTFNYGQIGLADRTGYYNLAAFNFFETIEKMTIEMLGTSFNRVIGNAVNGNGGNSHGVRFSGYGADHINTPSVGSVVCGNVINGMLNAYAMQNTAKYNSVSTSHSRDLTGSVIVVTDPTVAANATEFNSAIGLTFKNVKHAVQSTEGQYNHFSVIGTDTSDVAIQEKNGAGLALDGHNKYEGTMKNLASDGVYLLRKRNRLDVDLINVTGTGVVIAVGADGTTGDIKVDGANIGVNIYSNNNVLDIHVTNCTEVSGKSIQINGSNNVINLYTDKNVLIGGSGNVVSGYVGGTITKNGSGSNDFTKVNGYSERKTLFGQTTDATLGTVSVTHGLKTSVAAITASHFGSGGYTIIPKSINTTTIVFEIRTSAGALATGVSLAFGYIAEAY